ncbi:hypothetical protein Nocox_37410 [Nonomuraea coxensis DSM 45129]|uniref:Proline-rich protein n=1 Tax=Nonomuraea coxensis DSM 45129 TaxID=1122611 RepID=A0ABX8UBY8_9ACTN|nr:hypothetical protein [Nonomuraea coxensis]QYC45035.1 hypothetical protein Nocox_37410 [Nonomuraea coxensis DSM 45129]
MTPAQYARAVREAVGDHPDREELLEDLDDHLAEIAAESPGLPLEDRLGPPARYAEELMAAYGGRAQSRRTRGFRPRAWAARAHAALLRHGPYRTVADFLPELRPGWWVLRGYLLAMLLVSLYGYRRAVPENPADWAVVAALVWASVWLGRRRGGRPAVLLAGGVNALAALALFAGLVAVKPLDHEPAPVAHDAPISRSVVLVDSQSSGLANIRPYAKDGTPLTDVYLYDQDGNPVITDPASQGYTVDRSCGEPVLNRYPLPLKKESFEAEPTPSETPAACPTANPTVSPTVSPAVTPGAERAK